MKWDFHQSQPHYNQKIGLPIDTGGPLTKEKAREMLHHGEAHGHPLTKKQRGLFDAIAQGKSYKQK